MSLARVRLRRLDAEVSALGLGCASLGSRVAPAAGLAALDRAFAAGVTWFDVAPSYGDGQAERLLGQFIRGRRDQVQVLTKVGIAPPAPSLKQRLARPAMRLALAAMPGLRAAIRSRRPAAAKLPLTAAMVERSLDASLGRLGTDHVDVLALHDAEPGEAAREDVILALERVVKAGKARLAAIASSPEAARAGLEASPVYGLAQMANNPLHPFAGSFLNGPIDLVTHSVFGADDGIGRLAGLIEASAALRTALAAAGYDGPARRAAIDYLADYAFAANAAGVVLVSMFKAEHLAANLARHARRRDADAIARIAALIASLA
jgi:aryl-alcohol dehydrogenase-like predicted oxidoreductase